MKFFTVVAAVVLACSMETASAEEPNAPLYIQGGSLTVLKIEGGNQWAAYSAKAGKWSTHTFPDGVAAVPIVNGGVIAFHLSGKAVSELAAVDQNGVWEIHKLPKATDAACVPIIAGGVAVVAVDGNAHAFSGRLGKWDTLKGIGTATPEVNGPAFGNTADSVDFVRITTATKMSMFSANSPTWATIDFTGKGKK